MKIKKIDFILVIILVSYFLILLDNSIVFTGSIKISEELKLDPVQLTWVSNAYAFTFGSFLLFFGKLSDIIGRRKIFIIGLVIFGISSLLVGLAQNFEMIVIARAIQGIGSSILAPTTLAILVDNYQGERRLKAISYYGATAGIGASLGLLIGGILAGLLSWRYGFFINFPITIVLIFLTRKYIKKDEELSNNKLDIVGTVLSIVGIFLFVYGIEANYLISLLGAVIIAIFVFYETKTPDAIMPMDLFKSKIRVGAYLSRSFYMAAMMSFWFITPQILQIKFGFTPMQAGIGFFPLTIVNFFVSLKLFKLTEKFGQYKTLLLGLVTIVVGMVLVTALSGSQSYLISVGLPMVLLGAGQGLTLSLLTSFGVFGVAEDEAGAASGVVNMLHQIAAIIGLSVVTLATLNISDINERYHYQMLICSIYLILALVASILIYRKNSN